MSPMPTGTFCWADLMPVDQARAIQFYSDLVGWSAVGSAESGGYALAFDGTGDDSNTAAGINPAFAGATAAWTVYLATDDVEATLDKIGKAGGKELVKRTDIPGMGIAALAADPGGAPFGLWQATGHDGFGNLAQIGGFSWAEVYSRDAAASRDFFTKVFGLESKTLDESADFTYYSLSVPGADAPTFGVMQMGNQFPPTTPAHFAAYLSVKDVDRVVNRMALRGATVINAPSDTPFGRLSTLLDSEGAMIKLVTRPTE